MADLVRVRIKNGNKIRLRNMGRALAEASDNVEILADQPTHHGDGRAIGETTESGLPPRPTTTVADQATAKKAVMPADNTKEKS